MKDDAKLVQLIVEAILHLKSCAGGRTCPECVKSAAIVASALADAVAAAKALETASNAVMAGIHSPLSAGVPPTPMVPSLRPGQPS